MKNKYLLPGLSFFFLIIILIYLANLYVYARDYHGYILGDWVITFGGGFVRRGLSGYSMIALSDLLNTPVNFTVMFIQLILYLAYMLMLFFLVRKKEMDIWFIIFLLSPATLLFPINDSSAVGRKEILLFFIFAWYLHSLNKGKLKNYFWVATFSIVLLIATFFHELVFFYTPYFILAAYIKSRIDQEPFQLSRSLLVIIGSVLTMIPLFFYGKTIKGDPICEELMKKGLDNRVCYGVIGGPTEFPLPVLFENITNDGYFWSYGIGLLLSLIPVAFLVNHLKSEIVTLKRFFVTFLLLFLFSSPMFILAIDWGRWINIHFIMLLFTSTLLLKDSSPQWKDERFFLPRLWNAPTKFLKYLSNTAFLIICFSYLAFWYMRHFGNFSVLYLDKFTIWGREIEETIGVTKELLTMVIDNIQG